MEVGELISFYRRQCGMTIDELAEKSGVAKGTLNKIMGGITKAPTLDNMKAIARALGKRLDDFDDEPELADMFSPSERDHIKKYRSLDHHGQEAVDSILDVEYRRCEADRQAKADTLRESREQAEVAEEIMPVVTLHQPYTQVAAAEGSGAFLQDDGYDEITVEMNEYTRRADVIMKVVGRSMEPEIHDGDRVLVRVQPSVNVGEIGVFVLDGQGYLKERAADRLVSLNPDVADVYVGDLQQVECYGKFIKVLNPDWIKE